jgi:hypothetical protein
LLRVRGCAVKADQLRLRAATVAKGIGGRNDPQKLRNLPNAAKS